MSGSGKQIHVTMTQRLAPRLSRVSLQRLVRMQAAADEVLAQLERMAALGTTPVGQVLEGVRVFAEDAHYPDGDVYDDDTGSQYYYHAHRGSQAENGHFHLFVRGEAIPESFMPAMPDCTVDRPTGSDAIAHLIAVSIGYDSLPTKLFTTNQWVTGETFYGAADTAKLVDVFDVRSDTRCVETSRWVSSLVVLFRPQIVHLLATRDRRLSAWARQHPHSHALEAEELEVISETEIDIDTQIACIDAEIERRQGPRSARKVGRPQ